ncbi:hypothetical protein B1759_12625 [Rubrivirga sp. SAORIC476]|uniref:DUF2911 domain-containing protein n=1 Tax=Rubrivirga sp. SAORIC476 TaxID=1961794 RepID=UPI000BA916E1|nr:DUF2911 domain-containing protein [Rubrivirga sp. SAORIC476]PAP79193.1 hypothetical protein B1759_12625 [Rubrivirga sp. SAORIC476]
MRVSVPLVVAFAVLSGCATTPTPSTPAPLAETGAFVTVLGDDTLAVERFTRTTNGMEATVALRAPRTTLISYRLDLDDAGGLEHYDATVSQPLTGEVLRRTSAEPVGDSLRVTVAETMGETTVRMVPGAARPLPFIDMVHWPFELMVARAVEAGGPLDQPLFTERGVVAFTSDVAPDGAVTVRHPFRGPMSVDADADGRLLMLDAGATTRKLVVRRVADVDVEAAATRYAEHDAAGRSVGDLSGRGETVATIAGATIAVDYGQPQMRGREIWGALVPWGELWRTGANRATHLTTDRALVLDPDGAALAVPAGEYTLYSIPEAEGGLLIVNRQTGQGGTTYEATRDLGRVPLTRSSLTEAVEVFTIGVEAEGRGGRLALRWASDAFSVPFAVAE